MACLKKKYSSMSQADRMISIVIRKERKGKMRRTSNKPWNAYFCRQCNAWHIGHR